MKNVNAFLLFLSFLFLTSTAELYAQDRASMAGNIIGANHRLQEVDNSIPWNHSFREQTLIRKRPSLSYASGIAQSTPESTQWPAAEPQQAIYVEGGGSAIWYSLNYEYRFRKHLSGRLGYGGWTPDAAGYFLTMINSLIGSRSHWLEIGAGARLGIRANSDTQALTLPVTGFPVIIGYRYQPSNRGMLFRLSFTPLRADPYFWGGISLGYEF